MTLSALRSVSRAAATALAALLTASAPANAARDPNFTLSVTLSGARNDKGQLAVALFASKEDFPRQERALRGQVTGVSRGGAVVRFSGLSPGVYAIAVLHDENTNSKMDFNFLGMPLEGYGFSNDAPVMFGPPSFEAAAFKLVARHSRTSIRLRYFLR